MPKKTRYPSPEELVRVMKIISKKKGSRGLHPNASAVERLKYSLCAEFIKYARKNEISQRELARRLKVSESRVSEIVHYYFDTITIDKLVELLERLDHTVELKIA